MQCTISLNVCGREHSIMSPELRLQSHTVYIYVKG